MIRYFKKDLPPGYSNLINALIVSAVTSVLWYFGTKVTAAEAEKQMGGSFFLEALKAPRSDLCKMTLPLLAMGEDYYDNIIKKPKSRSEDSIISKKILSEPIGGEYNTTEIIWEIAYIYEDMKKIRGSDLFFRKEYDDFLQGKLRAICRQKTVSSEVEK